MSNILKYQNPSSPLLNPHKIIENIPAREWGPRKINEDYTVTEGEGTSFLRAPFQYWGNKGLGLQNEKLARDLVSDFTWMMIKNPNYNLILDKNYQSYDDAINYLNHLEGLKKYLHLPYDTGLLMESKYKPTRLQGTNKKTYKFKSSTVPGYWDDVVEDMVMGEHNKNQYYDQSLNEFTAYRDRDEKGDFVSIYDEWDYNPAVRGGNKKLNKVIDSVTGGKPFVIYDRVYLDDYYDIPEEARGNPFITPAVVTAYKKGGRIHIKKKNRGSFTRWCKGKVTEECIRRGKNSSNPAIRKKATFAANARRWKHENGGILKAQEGTGNLYAPHPLSPVGIALNQARAMAKMKGEQHLPPGVKEVVGPDGKKVVIRTEQPLVPLEQNIAEWLPGTGDIAEVGYIADDVKNGNLGSATLGAGLLLLPGNAGKLLKTNVGKKISNFLNKDLFNYDELWAKVKHPTWQKYYHGSPKEFDIKNFHKGTIADSGLHMSDRKEVAEYFAESGLYNSDKSTVYEFYAPKPTMEFMDLHKNGINMLSGNTQRIAGNHLGKGTFDGTPHGQLEYRALRENGGEDVIDFLPTHINDRFGNTIEPYQLKRDVTIPIEKYHWPDRPKHVDDRLKEMRKQYDTAIENYDYDIVELLNSEVSDIMAENGHPVIKYANNNAFEGGGMSYMLFDRSKLHLINPEHQFKMKHALTGLGAGLGVGYGISQLKDEEK